MTFLMVGLFLLFCPVGTEGEELDMKAKQFAKLEHFSAGENWGNLEKVQWQHVHHLYLIRKELKRISCDWPMVIHCCHAESGHSSNSYHYQGLATDFHFHTSVTLKFQLIWLEQAISSLGLDDFLSVGVYPEWKPEPGGFHIDSRGTRLRWVKIKGEYKYGDTNKILSYLKKGDGP